MATWQHGNMATYNCCIKRLTSTIFNLECCADIIRHTYMRKTLLKLLILFPCTAMGIMEFTFDTTTSNSHICLFARHENGNKIHVRSNIPSCTVKNAYILLQRNYPRSGQEKIKYSYSYKMITVDCNDNILVYRFVWTEDINKIFRKSTTKIIEDSIITTSLDEDVRASDFDIFIEKNINDNHHTYMRLFHKCPNLTAKTNIKYMSLKYTSYTRGEIHQQRRRLLLINDELFSSSN